MGYVARLIVASLKALKSVIARALTRGGPSRAAGGEEGGKPILFGLLGGKGGRGGFPGGSGGAGGAGGAGIIPGPGGDGGGGQVVINTYFDEPRAPFFSPMLEDYVPLPSHEDGKYTEFVFLAALLPDTLPVTVGVGGRGGFFRREPDPGTTSMFGPVFAVVTSHRGVRWLWSVNGWFLCSLCLEELSPGDYIVMSLLKEDGTYQHSPTHPTCAQFVAQSHMNHDCGTTINQRMPRHYRRSSDDPNSTWELASP